MPPELTAKRRVVVFDRDGTLVDFVRDPELGSVVSAFHPDQLRLLPGVISGLQRLSAAGYLIAIATNQPGAAKGEVPLRAILRTNEALVARLADSGVTVASVAACLHHPIGGPGGDPALIGSCTCRKPAPGLLNRLLAELGVAPESAWMVGDTAADLGAARGAAVRCALVVTVGRCELCPLQATGGPQPGGPDIVAGGVDDAVTAILAAEAPPGPRA